MSKLSLSPGAKQRIWDELRPYADTRIFIRDLPGFPALLKPVVRWSIGLGGIMSHLIGSDPGPMPVYNVKPQPEL